MFFFSFIQHWENVRFRHFVKNIRFKCFDLRTILGLYKKNMLTSMFRINRLAVHTKLVNINNKFCKLLKFIFRNKLQSNSKHFFPTPTSQKLQKIKLNQRRIISSDNLFRNLKFSIKLRCHRSTANERWIRMQEWSFRWNWNLERISLV